MTTKPINRKESARQAALPDGAQRPRSPQGGAPPGPRLTLEAFLVLVLAVAAFALRAVHAEWMPLDVGEAALALPAWQVANAMNATVTGAPLLFHLERLAFWLLGNTDGIARLMPALFGALAVLLAPALRRYLGPAGALATAALLALAPLWTYWGRQVSEVTVGTFALLLVLAALAPYGDRAGGTASGESESEAAAPGRRDSRQADGLVGQGWLVAVALGIAFAAGGPARSALVAALVVALGAFAGGKGRRLDALWSAVAGPDGGRRWLVAAAVSAILAATGLFTALDGIGAAVVHWGAWIAALGTPGSPWSAYLFPMVVYGPLTLVMGLVGLVLALWRRTVWEVYLAVWTLLSLFAGLLAGRPEALADLVLPLTLLAAMTLGSLAELVWRHFTWAEDGVMIAMLTVVLLYALNYAVAVAEVADAGDGGNMLQLIAALSIVASLLVILTVVWRNTLVLRVAGTVATLALGLLAWSNGTALNYRAGDQLREPMRPTYVAPSARMMSDDLHMASWFNTRDPYTMAVVADPSLRPVLAWYLRKMPVTWRKAADSKVEARAVITPVEDRVVVGAAPAFGPGAYRGRAYPVVGSWEPSFGTTRAFLQWYLQRRRIGGNIDPTLAPPQLTQAVLYLQVDASAPSEEAP